MRRALLLLGLLGGGVIGGCGGDGRESPASTGTTATAAAGSSSGSAFSCDFSVSGTHECAEFADLSAADEPAVRSACADMMGTPVGACSTTGQRLGTCVLSEGGVTETVIFYVGAGLTGFEAHDACTAYAGMWTAD
jgi:hypothetical protein